MKKRILLLLSALLLYITIVIPAFATGDLPRLVDNADLVTDSEESALISKLDEISERQQVDIVIVTADSLDGKTPVEYADDFYDYNGYGIGSGRDGVLLLVSMEYSDWWMSTCGYGITAITDAGIEYISDEFVPYLSSGDYLEAFTAYADLCDEFFGQALSGQPYDIGHMPKGTFGFAKNLLVALIIGFVVALIATGVMKGKLKTVRSQSAARNYIKANSMNITENRDFYLYSHVNRTARPKETHGGSGTHTSSSGSTHGGGGGKF